MEKSLSWPRDRVLLVAGSALLASGLIFGGAPERYPIPEVLLFLISIAVLGLIAWSVRYRNLVADLMAAGSPARVVAYFVAIYAGLLVLQILPLPPALVGLLPGRQLIEHSLLLADCEACWTPLSVAPELTARSLASLAGPVAMFLVGIMSGRRARRLMFWTIAAVVALNSVVGVLQAATEGNWGRFYDSPHIGSALGFFRNRNHMAIACVSAIPLLFARFAQMHIKRERRWTLEVIAVGLLLVVIVATKSRTGVALGGMATLASVVVFYRIRLTPRRLGIAAATVFAIGLIIYQASGALGELAMRFAQVGDDFRWIIWPASVRLVEIYNWAGVGSGGFVPAYNANEQLNDVYAVFANAAHNDYLQFVIENGIAGIVLLGGVIAALIYAGARFAAGAVDERARDDCAAAIMVTFLLAFHSFFDYPLRTGALATVAALMVGVIARSIRTGQKRAVYAASGSMDGLSGADSAPA